MSNAPCKGCEERWFDEESCKTCHSTCKKYLDFRAERDLENKKRYEEHQNSYWPSYGKSKNNRERLYLWK